MSLLHTSLWSFQSPTRTLCSSAASNSALLCLHIQPLGLSLSGPTVWNPLSDELQMISSSDSFRKHWRLYFLSCTNVCSALEVFLWLPYMLHTIHIYRIEEIDTVTERILPNIQSYTLLISSENVLLNFVWDFIKKCLTATVIKTFEDCEDLDQISSLLVFRVV